MLSPKQYATYSFIKDFITRNQYAPTMAEIAIGIGIKSRGVVHRYVQALAEAELVRIIPGKRRNIELTDNTQGTELPLMGKIAAGRPIEAIHSNETIDIAYTLLGNDRYALKVQGDSMIEDGIHDGDFNVCVGAETLRQVYDGNLNTSVGYQSGYNLKNIGENVFVGEDSHAHTPPHPR